MIRAIRDGRREGSRVRRPVRRRVVSVTAMAAVLGLNLVGSMVAPSVFAAAPVFGDPTITSSFEAGVSIVQPVTLSEEPSRVELLVTYADASGPEVIPVEIPAQGAAELRYALSPVDGHISPNTRISMQWRITSPAPALDVVLGPLATTTYADDRFEWQTASDELVRVHWYEGGRAFGERALGIATTAVVETSELLGVEEDEPIDFFVYADREAFYDALGPATRENVGGQANSEIRTLFAHIPPSQLDDPWVEVVIPHEMVHLVFDTAVQNPYHFPPRWLNEGLATYLSEGYDADKRGVVEEAVSDGSIIPLAGLTGQFPTAGARFLLAYAESVSAVDYLIRTYGQESLVTLITSYADGRSDDEAFEAAIGIDVTAFDAAWLADLGADPPVRHGPQDAPPGPVLGAPTGPIVPGDDAADLLPVAAVGLVGVLVIGLAAAWFLTRRRSRGGSVA